MGVVEEVVRVTEGEVVEGEEVESDCGLEDPSSCVKGERNIAVLRADRTGREVSKTPVTT